jgi:hypothetical protein
VYLLAAAAEAAGEGAVEGPAKELERRLGMGNVREEATSRIQQADLRDSRTGGHSTFAPMLPRLALGARACLSSSRTLALSRSVTYFTKSHEYLNVGADGTALVGVTDHAQGQLGDVVFVGLPEVGATFKKG